MFGSYVHWFYTKFANDTHTECVSLYWQPEELNRLQCQRCPPSWMLLLSCSCHKSWWGKGGIRKKKTYQVLLCGLFKICLSICEFRFICKCKWCALAVNNYRDRNSNSRIRKYRHGEIGNCQVLRRSRLPDETVFSKIVSRSILLIIKDLPKRKLS